MGFRKCVHGFGLMFDRRSNVVNKMLRQRALLSPTTIIVQWFVSTSKLTGRETDILHTRGEWSVSTSNSCVFILQMCTQQQAIRNVITYTHDLCLHTIYGDMGLLCSYQS